MDAFREGLAGGLFEEHEEGVQDVIGEDLEGAAGDVVAETDVRGSRKDHSKFLKGCPKLRFLRSIP